MTASTMPTPTASATRTSTAGPTVTPSAKATATATPPPPAFDGGGAFVSVIAGGGPNGDKDLYFGGTVSPYFWVTSYDIATCDVALTIDQAPGAGASWTVTADYAALPVTQNCNDVTSWSTASLGSISGARQKTLTATAVAMPMTAPACFRGHMVANNAPNNRNGGVASFHCRNASGDAPIHLQGGGAAAASTAWYGGQVGRAANSDRTYWMMPGASLAACSGVVAVPDAPGSGRTWHVTLATSTTALTNESDCSALTYATTGDLCTITGTNKSCSWTPVVFATPMPDGGCIQVRASCTGGTCTQWSTSANAPNFGIDCSTSAVSPYTAGASAYESAGSGAFDSNHQFGAGPWAITDALWPFYPESQHYWVAPPNGLNACAAAFSFTNAIVGSGSFSFAFSISDTALGPNQSCVDLTYSDTTASGMLAVGDRSVLVPQTNVTIPGNHCFAVQAIVDSGAPSAITTPANEFNWMAHCWENAGGGPTAIPTPTP